MSLNILKGFCGPTLRHPKLAKEADKFNPGSPLVADTLGWALFKKGEVKQAEKYVSRAYEKMQNNVAIVYHMGAVSHQLGNHEAAASALEKVVENDSHFPGRDEAVRIYQQNYAN
nr:hypothetical protein [uncultured Desulfobacter sp.]